MPITSVRKDPEALTMTVVADFAAPLQRLWDAYADPRQLERFWGPPTYPATFTRRLLDEVEDAILAAGPDEVALIIAEPVQNSGGCLTPPPGYWRGLRALADRYEALLMADEVITGCGRLGEWFGIAREGVVPDLVSLAKGLTSAYAPMGSAQRGSA